MKRAMRRLNTKGRGIILMHDIHRATAMALPILLKELKANGYEVVHVVAEGERPKSVPELMALPTTDEKVSPTVRSQRAQRRSTKSPHQEGQRTQASSGALILPKRPK